MKLYTVRHAISLSNETGVNASINEKYCGGLSKIGKIQAIDLIPKLTEYNFNLIVTSPLKRTIETVEPYISSLNVKPEILVLELVQERNLGDLTGTTKGIVAKYLLDNKITNRVAWIPVNGESIVDVYSRAKEFIDFLKNNYNNEINVLLCSHSVFLRALDVYFKGLDIEFFYNLPEPENGEIRIYNI